MLIFNNPQFLEKRKRSDPRTNLHEWEFQEHELRMKILRKEFDYAEQKVLLIKEQRSQQSEKHEVEMGILKLRETNGHQDVLTLFTAGTVPQSVHHSS